MQASGVLRSPAPIATSVIANRPCGLVIQSAGVGEKRFVHLMAAVAEATAGAGRRMGLGGGCCPTEGQTLWVSLAVIPSATGRAVLHNSSTAVFSIHYTACTRYCTPKAYVPWPSTQPGSLGSMKL